MFLNIILTSHNLIRWLVLLFLLLALIRLALGVIKNKSWEPQDLKAVRKFSLWMTIQFLLGLVLFFIPNGFVQLNFAHHSMEEITVNKDRVFFVMFHPTMMFLALALSHVTSVVTRKVTGDRKKFLIGTSLLLITAVIILASIPWHRSFVRFF